MTALTRSRTRSTGILIEFIISVPVPTLVKDMVGARSALRFGLFEVFVDDVCRGSLEVSGRFRQVFC